MEEFKERLIKEQKDLLEKVNKLSDFVCNSGKFSELDDKQQRLLQIQLGCMISYEGVLRLRMEDLGIKVE